MALYRKKPVVIEAIQWTGYNRREILDFIGRNGSWGDSIGLTITTLEGVHSATEGDYIIKGIAGEFYPCKPEIFSVTYDEVTQ